MPKRASSFELALNERPRHTTLTRWLYEELRRAILDRRLRPGSRLPATRDFAHQYNVSRGTAVTAFEQLQAEGYLVARVGAGTLVNERLPEHLLGTKKAQVQVRRLPGPVPGWAYTGPAHPFRPYGPAISEFPVEIWARVAGRRLRRVSASLLAGGDVRGYGPLREAIAAYLGSSRGVNCSPGQIVIVSGAQQGLDLLARFLIKPGEAVWLEDPGYFGAAAAFRNVGARIIPVPVDERGIAISKGKYLCRRAKAAYLTPAHQFPLGMTMPLERRLAILAWAREAGAFLIEDDYDSEYRFEGLPVPALQGLDQSGSVILLGSFNKVLFPSLRIGYVVLPTTLIGPFLAFRFGVDLHPAGLDQAILCDFIVEGHFRRHIRRMRDLYAERLVVLQDGVRKYLEGLLELQPIQAGLNTAAFLRNGMTSQQAEAAALDRGIEAMALSRFALKRRDVDGLLLGFAAFDAREIRRGIVNLATALEHRAVSSK
ncbi:MAG TPA: PLP-dependent aminotransferase family protein [Candidatus Acidoferrum sp.]|nr:PLP-dependent aminotransferase family protein [Candidatus Acidoferrum sp.]